MTTNEHGRIEYAPTVLDSLRADLAHYEAQAAIVMRLIEDGDDSEWNTKRLSGWQWNITQTKAKIAREEAGCTSS